MSAAEGFMGSEASPGLLLGRGLGRTTDEGSLRELGLLSLEKRGTRWEWGDTAAVFCFTGTAKRIEPDSPHECTGERTSCRSVTVASGRFWGHAVTLYLPHHHLNKRV